MDASLFNFVQIQNEAEPLGRFGGMVWHYGVNVISDGIIRVSGSEYEATPNSIGLPGTGFLKSMEALEDKNFNGDLYPNALLVVAQTLKALAAIFCLYNGSKSSCLANPVQDLYGGFTRSTDQAVVEDGSPAYNPW